MRVSAVSRAISAVLSIFFNCPWRFGQVSVLAWVFPQAISGVFPYIHFPLRFKLRPFIVRLKAVLRNAKPVFAEAFSFTYLLYVRDSYSAVGASVFAWVFLHARDIASKP